MPTNPEVYDSRYTDYQSRRSSLRKWVRGFYLRSAATLVHGPTIDFGCGVGEFLRELPAGSIGLELNEVSVAHCVGQGLDVLHYNADNDDWALAPIAGRARCYRSLSICHVLEHLDRPAVYFRKLLLAARALGVDRVLVIVPGRSGFATDPTHLTFVDLSMLSDPGLVEGSGFSLQGAHYFPGNVRSFGNWFPHHELRAVYVAQELADATARSD